VREALRAEVRILLDDIVADLLAAGAEIEIPEFVRGDLLPVHRRDEMLFDGDCFHDPSGAAARKNVLKLTRWRRPSREAGSRAMSAGIRRVRIARQGAHDNCIGARMVLGCHSMKDLSWRLRSMRVSERELRAAAGDMRDQLRPRNVLRDAQDLLLKFQRDEIFSEYFANRIWAVLAMVLVFVLVSSVCSIDVMFPGGEPDAPTAAVAQALCPGRRGGGMGVRGNRAALRIPDLAGRIAAQKSRSERGLRVKIPAGVLAYLKYSRATLPWSSSSASIVLPGDDGAPRAPGRAAARRGIDSRSLSLQEARSLIAPVNSSPSAARTCTRGSPAGSS